MRRRRLKERMGTIPAIIGILAVWIVGGAVALSGPAHAYVLSGPHVLELMISKYGKANRLLVSQKQTVYSADAQGAGIESRETLRYAFPESFRSDLRSPTGERVHVVTKHDALAAIDGRIVNDPEDEWGLYKDILLYRSREILQQKLNWKGVDTAQSSLGRFQDRIAFVIGAQYPDESRSQVWVDKETFRPIRRLIIPATPAGEPAVLEIQYLDWQLFANNWYPARITFTANGRLVREIKVTGVQVNTNFPSDLFDIEGLKKRFLPPAPAAAEPPKADGMGEIKKTGEVFKNLYE